MHEKIIVRKGIAHACIVALTGSPSGTHMGWMWASGQGFTHLGPKWDPQGKTFISSISEYH